MFSIIPYNNRIAHRDNTGYMNPFNDDFFRAFFGNAASSASFNVDVEDKGDHYLLKADALYPEDYDFSIIFDTVANRKARHKMGKHHDPNLVVTEDAPVKD